MPLEDVQPGLAADGAGLVLFVPASPGIADTAAPTDDELTAVAVKHLTYGLVPDGFRLETTENTISSGRYTLKQVLELGGTVTDSLEIQYVYTNDDTDDVVRSALPEGTSGFIVHRLGYPNETAVAASQLVDVIPVKAGVQRRVPPTANTELQIVQKLYVTGTVQRFVEVVAGA